MIFFFHLLYRTLSPSWEKNTYLNFSRFTDAANVKASQKVCKAKFLCHKCLSVCHSIFYRFFSWFCCVGTCTNIWTYDGCCCFVCSLDIFTTCLILLRCNKLYIYIFCLAKLSFWKSETFELSRYTTINFFFAFGFGISCGKTV